MNKIENIDKNFAVKSENGEEMVWLDATASPFKIYGLQHENGGFLRMPQAVAERVNGGVAALNCNTAGGRVRFATDSPVISIQAELSAVGRMPHFTLCGSAGFDLYEDADYQHLYKGTFMPPYDLEKVYTSSLSVTGGSLTEYTINFPLYSGVKSLHIGLKSDSKICASREYLNKLPVVYYGSSITQGGCASRPGNSYQGIVSRALETDYINLGFSGNALGEDSMAEYIATLEMSAFVYDYDHNAPSVEHLQATHSRMFKTIRRAKPELPVILLSRPNTYLNGEEVQRRDVISATYQEAVKNGDKNVYFIDGSTITTAFGGDSCSVDGCHPNDLGFMAMANKITAVLKEVL